MSDNRSIAYQEGKVSIYRASGVGSCLTALVAAKLGYEEDRSKYVSDILTNAAREGNMHEGAVIDTLKSELGWRVRGGQKSIEMKVIPNVIIRGHIDGTCFPPKMKNERLLEVKTMSRDRFKKWIGMGPDARTRLLSEDFESYGWQISAYMHQMGMAAIYTVKNRDSGVLDISEITVPPVDLKTIKKKIIEAEMWFKRGEIPPCTTTSSSKFFCPFPYLHEDVSPFGDEPDSELPPISDARTGLILTMAEHYAELAKKVATMKPIDEERKEVGKKLLTTIGVDGPKKTEVGQYRITRVDNTYSYVDKGGVAEELGVSVAEYEAVVAKNTTKKLTPYVTVKTMGTK